jgi:dimethylsulfone monooxygenase
MTLAMHEQDGLLGATRDLPTNPVFTDQKRKLGVFSSNCSGGVIMSAGLGGAIFGFLE